MVVAYTLAVPPAHVLLGETLTVALVCTAKGDAPHAVTFDDGSLELALEPPGRPEPARAYPNRQMTRGAGVTHRQSAVGVEHLRAGEERRRSFDLLATFGAALLDAGRFSIGYTLLVDGDERQAQGGPHGFVVESGPDAVPRLFGLLDEPRLEVRERAAELLHLMTAEGFDYDPAADEAERRRAAAAWRAWWDADGRHLPWSYESRGATFGPTPRAAPPSHRSAKLGGIAYPLSAFSSSSRELVVRALQRFAETGAADALDGRQLVADAHARYPARPARAHCDDALTAALSAAVGRLTAEARQGKAPLVEARLVLSTIQSVACGDLGAPLRQLRYATERSAAWQPLRGLLATVLDLQPAP